MNEKDGTKNPASPEPRPPDGNAPPVEVERSSERADEAIRLEHEQLLSIFDSIDEPIYVSNPESHDLLYVNEAFRKLWGKEVGRKCYGVLQGRNDPCPFCTNDRIFADGFEGSYVWEFRNERTGRWLCCIDKAIHWPGHGRVRYEMAVDITDRREAEARHIQDSRLQVTETLAGGVAHDFNNLMTSVLGNAELLKLRLRERPELSAMLDAIEESARRAADLAQQLLAFARGGKYLPRPLSLNDVVREVIRLRRGTFPHTVCIVEDLASDLRLVEADVAQMRQVVLNLAMNAVEAMGGEGTLTVGTRNVVVADESSWAVREGVPPGDCVQLSVSDTGPGMAEETRARLFEPFYSTKSTGRGLGLAAAYGIVKNHQGAIRAEDEPREGATFVVCLPATDKVPVVTPEPARPTPPANVLVVDDEESVLEVTARMARHLGYTCVTAVNGREAVDLARSSQEPIDVIILDLGMPVMDGVAAFPLLREARPEAKIILMSGYELNADSRVLLDAGAMAFVRKPFRMETLASEIRRALGK